MEKKNYPLIAKAFSGFSGTLFLKQRWILAIQQPGSCHFCGNINTILTENNIKYKIISLFVTVNPESIPHTHNNGLI